MGIELYSDKPKQEEFQFQLMPWECRKNKGWHGESEWIGVFQLRTPRGWLQFPTREKMLQSALEKRWQHKMFIYSFTVTQKSPL